MDDRATRVTGDLEQLGAFLERAEERTGHHRAREAFAKYRGHVAEERRLVALGQTRVALQIAEAPRAWRPSAWKPRSMT